MGKKKQISLHNVLSNSYAKTKAKNINGYELDESLSNHNQQVYYNPKNKKLMYNIAGTHNISDWGTDAYLSVGKLKDTNRYKEAETTFKKAKEKYGVDRAKISGHSLGGTIAGYIGNPDKDEIYTLNKGATIGQPVRKNEHAYRNKGDLVSLLNANDPNIKNLINPNEKTSSFINDALNAHKVTNIKSNDILI
jgi:hypothetical protein